MRPPVGPDREIAAGVNRLAIQQHRARAAFAAVAADFGAGEPQMIAQQFHQRPAVFHFDALGLPFTVRRMVVRGTFDAAPAAWLWALTAGTAAATTTATPVPSRKPRRESLPLLRLLRICTSLRPDASNYIRFRTGLCQLGPYDVGAGRIGLHAGRGKPLYRGV